MADQPSPRRRFQFSLRALFLWVFIVASLTVLSKACYEGWCEFLKSHPDPFSFPTLKKGV
jgi:hypothetical protein